MLRKWWEYIKAWLRGTSSRMMDPAVEIQMAIDQARAKNQDLRNQAANIVAHRTQLEGKIENEADVVGETREMAKQAILKAEEARAAGDTAGVDKWTASAQVLALKLQAAENNLTSLTAQYEVAIEQAEDAKSAVQTNATRLQELSAKQIELMGALEQAKMQEAVNEAVATMDSTLDDELPSLAAVEEKIERRKAQAMAKAEIHEATPQGAEAELREAINRTAADAKLDELRAELGLATGGGATEPGEATGLEA